MDNAGWVDKFLTLRAEIDRLKPFEDIVKEIELILGDSRKVNESIPDIVKRLRDNQMRYY